VHQFEFCQTSLNMHQSALALDRENMEYEKTRALDCNKKGKHKRKKKTHSYTKKGNEKKTKTRTRIKKRQMEIFIRR